jgi:glycosyltransferase involved in cell wall biosynthesis
MGSEGTKAIHVTDEDLAMVTDASRLGLYVHRRVNRLPLSKLVVGATPRADRILYTNLWFRGHNNPRYEELLPRLRRLDAYLLVLSRHRIARGLEYRALRLTRTARERLLFAFANQRYRSMFTTDNEQIRWFRGTIVSDVDDPRFTPREVALLNRPNVAAYVVTAKRAGRRFEELGVEKPWHVIPQGVSLESFDESEARRIRALKRPHEVIVGYVAPWLRSRDDRDGENPLYNVDHLLELWEDVHSAAPEARLWLIGEASLLVHERCAGRADIALLGRLPRSKALAHISNFDVALYPRTRDQGIQAAKVAEYMGMGAPTVSYDFEVTEHLRETGAGVLVGSPREFVEATIRLIRDGLLRRELAGAARRAGERLDWSELADRYEELLDAYLE